MYDYLTKEGDYAAEWQKESVQWRQKIPYYKLIEPGPPIAKLEVVHLSLLFSL